MRKGVGGSAGVLALLALVLHTQFPGASEGPDRLPEHETGHAGTSGKAAKDKNASAKDDEVVEGPWIATQAFFQIPAGARSPEEANGPNCPTEPFEIQSELLTADGKSDRGALLCLLGVDHPEEGQRWSIIATVPDPLHTRMTLRLDGQLEAIERSLQAAGWEFAGQWLPWMDRFDATTEDIDDRRKQRRLQLEQEQLPGVLIFRSTAATDEKYPASSQLFVFVVPETATSGVSGPPFFAALHMASALSSKDHEIGILGPTFSGSFSSLAKIVEEWEKRPPDQASPQIHHDVYSGSASNAKYAAAFEAGTHLSYHSGIAGTPDYSDAVCQVLEKYGIGKERAALLKEDESGYSQSFDTPGACPIQTYVFPRDISHLRNAYQEASAAAVRDPYTGGPPGISFSIKDPNSGEDSIPVFSDIQTPLSQDAILDSIMRDLQRTKKRLVFIAATNSLDVLFLMRVLRRDCPDTRMIIENPDVLFIPAASHDSLTGTLMLSTYPMFPQGEQWLDDPNGSQDRFMFPDSTTEGLYNATQFLLVDLQAMLLKGPDGKPLPKLRAFRQFPEGSNRARQYPGIWLLTLNRFGFQPVDLLSVDLSAGTSEGAPRHWFKLGPVQKTGPYQPTVSWPRGWATSVLVVSLGIFAACSFVFSRNVSISSLRPLTFDLPRPVRKPMWLVLTDGNRLRMQALLGVCLSLTALVGVLASPSWWPVEGWTFYRCLVNLVSLIVFLTPAVTFAALLRFRNRQPTPDRAHEETPQIETGEGVPGLRPSLSIGGPWLKIGLFLFAAICWFLSCYSCGKYAYFFRLRAFDLLSGSSPALPLIFLGLLFCCFSMFHFKRYTMAGAGRPRLPFTSTAPGTHEVTAFDRKMQAAYDGVNAQIMAPDEPTAPNRRNRRKRAGIGAICVLVCLIVLGFYPRAFELLAYNLALLAVVPVALYCLAIGCYDLTLIWRRLKGLLSLVELLPLGPAIKRVAREWPRRPAWALRQSVSRHALNRQMLYALHRRVVILQTMLEMKAVPSAALNEDSLAEARKDLKCFAEIALGKSSEQPVEQSIAALDFLSDYEESQKKSAEIAASIYERDLRPAWRGSLNEDERSREDSSKETDEQKYQRYCSDFFALQLCRYFAYAVEQVRRAALSVSLCFLLLILFFNSYSAQGPLLIAQFIAALFVAVGFVIVWVFAQMERNTILSIIGHSTPGELGGEFWLQLITLGGLPLVGVLAHLFPPVSEFLFQWVAPSVQAVH